MDKELAEILQEMLNNCPKCKGKGTEDKATKDGKEWQDWAGYQDHYSWSTIPCTYCTKLREKLDAD